MSKPQTLRNLITSRNSLLPIPTSSTSNAYVCFSCRLKQQQRRAYTRPSTPTTKPESTGINIAWTPGKKPKDTSPDSLQFTTIERAQHGSLQRSRPTPTASTASTASTTPTAPPPPPTGRLPPRLKSLITNRLSYYHQARYEANVATSITLLRENRLVNMPELRHNSDLWRALLAFRRRVDGDTGVVDIFRGMRLRDVAIPTTGHNADNIWTIFFETAFRRKELLHEIVACVIGKRPWARRAAQEKFWRGFYEKVMKWYLLREPTEVGRIHGKLVAMGAAPAGGDWGGFMIDAARETLKVGYWPHRRAMLNRLRGVYAKLENMGSEGGGGVGVYAKMVPFLALHATMTETFKWHKQGIAQGDKPADSSPADKIFEYLGTAGIMAEIKEFVNGFVKNEIPIVESSLVSLVGARGGKEDVLVMLVHMIRAGTIDKGLFRDEFWKVVLKDRTLQRGTLIAFMKLCGVSVLEEKAIGALLRRFKDDNEAELNGYIDQIRQHGISIPEDKLLQIQADFDRTGGVETSSPNQQAHQLTKEYYDSLLATNLTQRNLPTALSTLKDMLAYSIPIRPPTLRFLLRSILRPRRCGHAPKTLPEQQVSKDDLALAINTLLSCIRGGLFVPPSLWQEIFRRLGMEYQLADLERLAVYLIEWYHPIRGQTMLRRYATAYASVKEEERGYYAPRVRPLMWHEERRGESWLMMIRRGGWGSPLRRLFPRSFFAAVVEWGVLGVFRRRAGILDRLPGIKIPVGGEGAGLSREEWGVLESGPPGRSTVGQKGVKGGPKTPQIPTTVSRSLSSVRPSPPTTASPPFPPPSPQPHPNPNPRNLFGFSPFATDITWGLRLSYTLHRLGAHLDLRTLIRAVRIRARALYGHRPDYLRSPLNLSARARLLQTWPTLESFIWKINKDWRLLNNPANGSDMYGDNSTQESKGWNRNELFITAEWENAQGEERRRVLERVVLGLKGEEGVARRQMKRWRERRVEIGPGGRDRWGRWRLSGNERRRRGRVEREKGGEGWGGLVSGEGGVRGGAEGEGG